MNELQIVIDKIREIDSCLDAYEYSNRTYEEYVEDIKANRRGDNSLRRRCINGKNIWNTLMQTSLDDLKQMINLIYKKAEIDNKKMSILIANLKHTETLFRKNTDGCSIYPLKSESIANNLLYVISYLEKYKYI